MIRHIGLKDALLKAVNLQKDHSHQVLVERIETNKNGTTYSHKHWVNVDEVKATDKILRGHHNLPKNHAQHLSAMTVGRLSQESKDKTNEFFKKFNSLNDFCDALTKMDIPWKKNIDARINLMWAKMGLRAAIHNGFDVDKAWDKVKSALGIQSNQQANSQQQPTQSTTTSTNDKKSKGVTSQEAKDKANEFYKTFNNDRQSFFTALKNMGVTWKENADERINYMFAKTALGKAIDGGLDPFNANGKQQQQATPPTPPPPKDPDLIEAPPNATPEQLAWIEHINKITDPDVLKKCSVLGMVPEDVVSQRYLSNVAFGEMVKAYEGTGTADMVDAARDKFKSDVEGVGLTLKERNKSRGLDFLGENIGKLTDLAKVSGMKSDVISDNLRGVYRTFSMEAFTNPVNVLNRLHNYNNYHFNPFNDLNSAYSDYTTDKHAKDPDYRGDIRNDYHTNLGYTGADPDEYAERFDLQKEGVVRFLNKVAESTNDPDAKAKANELINDYGEIMKTVNGNHFLLNGILDTESYMSGEKPRSFSNMFYEIGSQNPISRLPEPGRAKALYEELEHNSDKLADVLVRECGGNNQAIKQTLRENRYNTKFSNGTSIDIYDEKGNKLKTVDLSNEGFKFGETELNGIDNIGVEYSYYKARQKLNLSVDLNDPDVKKDCSNLSSYGDEMTKTIIGVKSLKQLSTISFEDYQKIHGFANKFLGKRLNTSNWDERTPVKDLQYIFEDTNNGSDSVYTNMIMAYNNHGINSRIAERVDTSPRSQLNHGGQDYSGNFSYYSPDNLKGKHSRYKSIGGGWDHNVSQFGSAQELSDKITQQLNNTKIYSPEFLQNVKDFYDAKAKSEGLASGVIASKSDKLGKYSNLDDLKNSPLNEIIHDSYVNVLQYVPKMADKANFRKTLDKRLGYSEFDFNSAISKLNQIQPPTQTSNNSPDNLKELRQKLFDKATCSIQTLPPKESDAMQQDMIKNRFDYSPGEKTPGGTVVNDRVHKGRRVFFNTPMFKINNTAQWEKRYKDSKQAMIDNGADKKAYEDIDLFHGTKKWCLGGIIGRDQGWYMGEEAMSAGKMLGAGAYFGYKIGKSTVYACDDAYANIRSRKFSDDDNSANGILILVKGMMGENSKHHNSDDFNWQYRVGVGNKADMKYTSVYSDTGAGVNDYELAIKRNENILPEYFVDVSCRKIFDNIAIDKDGNYYELNSDYERVANAQKDYYDRKNRGALRPGEKRPDDWDGSGYTPKWDKNCKKIGMDELTD